MNYLLISHGSFRTNSGIHAFHIAQELVKLGVDCAVSIPDSPESVFDIANPSFKIIVHGSDTLDGLFHNGRGPDIIHAFTPRQHVRNETLRLSSYYHAPYVVHLEDNEEEILRAGLGVSDIPALCDLPSLHLEGMIVPWRIWPTCYRSFLAGAAGVTVLIARLGEFNIASRPELVFWPGFDTRYLDRISDSDIRKRLKLPQNHRLLVYSGMVHEVNAAEVESLLLAVAELNRRNYNVKLVKTGKDTHKLFAALPNEMADMVINLGYINRTDLPDLLMAADVLVQPGRSDAFNDYRFPSKLPEYLSTGKPVVLPETNIGLHLQDGINALLLKEGHYREIADAVEKLFCDPVLAKRIGAAGRDFAIKNLTWDGNVNKIYTWLVELTRQLKITCSLSDPKKLSEKEDDPKLIAFYLPQFHAIPENDAWWGKGFTEWTNVKRSKSNFKDHYQPRIPDDLGYYDLSCPAVMEKQTDLAKMYGIYGFCFYYYWFSGKRLLERPLETYRISEKHAFPFCICWANENWTRRWDGMDQEILIRQTYEDGWDDSFFSDILPYLRDKRYIHVDDKPLLILYRIDLIPHSASVIDKWKKMARSAGLNGLHIAAIQYIGWPPEMPVDLGADATVEFPPHLARQDRTFIDPASLPGIRKDFDGYIEDYEAAMIHYISRPATRVPWYRCLMPSWDNTARRGTKSHIYVHSSPQTYERWLQYLVDYSRCAPGGQPYIFVNAWNEWAEGAYLEPDKKYGMQYLEATSRALRGYVPIRYIKPFKLFKPIAKTFTEKKVIKRPSTPIKNPETNPAMLFCDEAFVQTALERYTTGKQIPTFSYATVRDFCDSWDNLNALSKHGDLKNVQRPWTLKTILSQILPGGKLLEFGGGQPLIAATLIRMGYDVTIVDPYDGTGNGPTEYDRYKKEFPEVRLIRGYFKPEMPELFGEEGSFDAVYSISVIEHIPFPELKNVFAAMHMYLKKEGLSIHAIDFIRKGNGETEHMDMLQTLTGLSGIDEKEIYQALRRMDDDVETYYISAEAHNAWRMGQTYDEFPMRVCVSLQLCTPVSMLGNDTA